MSAAIASSSAASSTTSVAASSIPASLQITDELSKVQKMRREALSKRFLTLTDIEKERFSAELEQEGGADKIFSLQLTEITRTHRREMAFVHSSRGIMEIITIDIPRISSVATTKWPIPASRSTGALLTIALLIRDAIDYLSSTLSNKDNTLFLDQIQKEGGPERLILRKAWCDTTSSTQESSNTTPASINNAMASLRQQVSQIAKLHFEESKHD